MLSVYQNVCFRVAELDLIEAQGVKVRSRVQWAEEGETSSRHFLRLEKQRGASDWISAMRALDGSVFSDLADICDSWRDFCFSLFPACPVDLDIQRNLLSNVSSSLPSDQVGCCEGHLSVSKVHAALLGMARGKSPGSDGFPMEFYVTFWDVLGPDLVEVLNASFDSGVLPPS